VTAAECAATYLREAEELSELAVNLAKEANAAAEKSLVASKAAGLQAKHALAATKIAVEAQKLLDVSAAQTASKTDAEAVNETWNKSNKEEAKDDVFVSLDNTKDIDKRRSDELKKDDDIMVDGREVDVTVCSLCPNSLLSGRHLHSKLHKLNKKMKVGDDHEEDAFILLVEPEVSYDKEQLMAMARSPLCKVAPNLPKEVRRRKLKSEEIHKNEGRKCFNCKQIGKCIHGKYLTEVKTFLIGTTVTGCGDSWPQHCQGRNATVIGGNRKVCKVMWESSVEVETSQLKDDFNRFRFKFNCDRLGLCDDQLDENDNNFAQKSLEKSLSVCQRLPDTDQREVWKHCEQETHRVMFCASDNIVLRGVGLLVTSPIRKVVMDILHKPRNVYGLFYSQHFKNVQSCAPTAGVGVGSAVLSFNKPVKLSCDRIYLLDITVEGGASLAAAGGEEFVSVAVPRPGGGKMDILFKFEDYEEGTGYDSEHRTSVEKGLVDRLFFQLESDSE